MASRAYKTLPSTFRKEDSPHPSQDSPHQSNRSFGPLSSSSGSSRTASTSSSSEGRLFGLNLHLGSGISNLISGGMNFFGQLRRKTPLSAPNVSSSPSLSLEPHLLSTELSLLSTPSASTKASFDDSGLTDLSATEVLEMTSFAAVPLAEGEHEEQIGLGHEFVPITTFNPTWCDLCRELIWGLYDTIGTRCNLCDLTCHEKCRHQIRLNCKSYERLSLNMDSRRNSSSSSNSSSTTDTKTDNEESTLANISTIRDEELLNESVDDNDDDVGTLKNPNLLELSPDFPEQDSELTLLADEPHTFSEFGKNILDKVPEDLLQRAIADHNSDFAPGQETVYTDRENFHGFIRVQLNLRRPINVLPGTRPPSVYTIKSKSNSNNNTTNNDYDTVNSTKDRTLTSFYLPCDTVKILHVEAYTTTADVIRNLLKKFRVVDNPHKFALYVKRPGDLVAAGDTLRSVCDIGSINAHHQNTLGRVRMRRLNDDEQPLLLALSWRVSHLDEPSAYEGETNLNNVFVLQENDPGEIIWESFSFPELKNFLRILDREEAWYKKRIHEKYDFLHSYMQHLINKKREDAEGTTPL